MSGHFTHTSLRHVTVTYTRHSDYRQKRKFDAGYGGRFGVADTVGSKLMGKFNYAFVLLAVAV